MDLFISLGDVSSDFAQAFQLIFDEELKYYGYITLAINWMPGVVAAIHMMSTKRLEYGVRKTLLWAGMYTASKKKESSSFHSTVMTGFSKP